MRRAAALVAVALIATATACGGSKPATSAAQVAPASTTLFVTGHLDVTLARALAFLPEQARLTRGLERAERITGGGAQLALVAGSAVAFAHPADPKALDAKLDAAGLAHARVRGFTVYSRSRAAVDLVRHAKARLADAPWFHPQTGDVTFAARSETVTVSAHGKLVVAERYGKAHSSAGAPPLAARVPNDALAAAAFTAGDLTSLPFAATLRAGLGVRVEDLAAAAPGGGVLFARAGVPVPSVTFLGAGGTLAQARRVVADLDPHAPAPAPSSLDGAAVSDVPLGALDLYYGRTGSTLALTDDPDAKLTSKLDALAPSGLPSNASAWAYLDVPQGLPALRSLAALAGTTLSRRFVARLDGLQSVLAYRGGGTVGVAIELR